MDGTQDEISFEILGNNNLSFTFTNLEIFTHGSYGEDRARDYKTTIKTLISKVQSIFPNGDIDVHGHEKHMGSLSIILK